MAYTDEEQTAIDEWIAEGEREYIEFANDLIVSNFRYREFVSRSKGRRNGKKIPRKCWTEIELYSYGVGATKWTTKPPLDDWAMEALNNGGYSEPLYQGIQDQKKRLERLSHDRRF